MKILTKLLFMLLTVLSPLILLMSSVRVLMTPAFLDYEYNLPKFPADPYGFTLADRLKWGKISMDYLTNNESDGFLNTLKFENGSPLYNERETSHMLDVRRLVQAGLKVWYGLLVFTVVVLAIALITRNMRSFWKAVSNGGWWTMGLIVLILAAVLINFDGLFAAFHALFFKGDSWLFFSDDTLIRLYPEKLWVDAFIYAGIFSLVAGAICAFLGARFAHHE